MGKLNEHEAARRCGVIRIGHGAGGEPTDVQRAAWSDSRHSPNSSIKTPFLLRMVILATLAFSALVLLAQQAPPTVMAGARLRVKFDTKVGTDISRIGDGVEVRLLKPVEAEGSEVLPIGTILTGRVLSVRKGDTHKKVVPVLRLAFEQVRLPDGRTFPVRASLAGLGISEQVDSEGAAIPTPNTKTGNVAAAAGAAGVGAGIGAIAGGGSGAAKGAAIGGAIGVLGDLLTRNSDYWDFTLKRGRKAWLRLDQDLVLAPASPRTPKNSDPASTARPSRVAQKLPEPAPSEYPETLPRRSPPPTSKRLPSSSNPSSNQSDPLLSILSGERRPAPFYVDTGPFAAAEEHAHWSPTGPQFVVITNPVEASAFFPGYCWPSLVRLETEDGRIHPPLEEQSEEAGSQTPYEIGQAQWRFRVNPGETPFALHVERPKGNTQNCPNGEPSRWLTLGTDQASVSLVGLPSLNNLAEVEQRTSLVHMGQLEVTLSAVAVASAEWGAARSAPPRTVTMSWQSASR